MSPDFKECCTNEKNHRLWKSLTAISKARIRTQIDSYQQKIILIVIFSFPNPGSYFTTIRRCSSLHRIKNSLKMFGIIATRIIIDLLLLYWNSQLYHSKIYKLSFSYVLYNISPILRKCARNIVAYKTDRNNVLPERNKKVLIF